MNVIQPIVLIVVPCTDPNETVTFNTAKFI